MRAAKISEKRDHNKNLNDRKPRPAEKSLQRTVGTVDGVVNLPIQDICEATGVQDVTLAIELCQQAGNLQSARLPLSNLQQCAELALAAIRGLGPENATQSMLAVQMLGVHDLAIMFLRRASK